MKNNILITHKKNNNILQRWTMEQNFLLKKIVDSYSKLTTAEKSVAEYIVDNYQKAAFLTSIQLGEAAEVSDTTVIRLANSLGYSKFSDFKKDLQSIIKDKITPKEKLDLTLEDLEEKAFIKEVHELDMQNLNKTYENLNLDSVNQVIDQICSARKIFAMGLGLSAAAVNFFSYRLKRIEKDIIEITGGSYNLVAQMSLLTEKDMFIAFDFPRYSREIYETLKFAKQKSQVPTVLITDSPLNPLQEFSDLTLIASNDALGFTNSIVGSVYIVNIITVGVILKDKQKSLASLEKMEKFAQTIGHCL